MGFIIDIVLIIAFVFSVVTAYKKGLLKSLVDSFGFIVSVVAASKIAGLIHMWIYDSFFKEKIVEAVRQKIVSSATSGAAAQTESPFTDMEFLSGFASVVGFDTSAIADKTAEIDLTAENAAELLTQTAIQPILTVIIRCVIFLVLAAIFIIGLTLVSKCLNKLIKITPLNGINKLFGGVFGTFKGLVTVILLTVLTVLLAALIESEVFDSMVSSSKIFEILNTKSNIFKIN